MTRPLPQLSVEDLRSHHFLIAVLHVQLFYVIDQAVHNLSALRQEERARRCDRIEEEQSERPTQFAVVALFSLFDSLQIVLLSVA